MNTVANGLLRLLGSQQLVISNASILFVLRLSERVRGSDDRLARLIYILAGLMGQLQVATM